MERARISKHPTRSKNLCQPESLRPMTAVRSWPKMLITSEKCLCVQGTDSSQLDNGCNASHAHVIMRGTCKKQKPTADVSDFSRILNEKNLLERASRLVRIMRCHARQGSYYTIRTKELYDTNLIRTFAMIRTMLRTIVRGATNFS